MGVNTSSWAVTPICALHDQVIPHRTTAGSGTGFEEQTFAVKTQIHHM